MSLDLYLSCPHCDQSPYTNNYTWNVGVMWFEIYPDDVSMVLIEGMTGEASLSKLIHAIKELEANPDKFKGMNPKNGWGSYDGFLNFVKELAKAAIDYPSLVWRASR